MSAGEIDTPAKGFRLRPRKNPYWVGISGGRGERLPKELEPSSKKRILNDLRAALNAAAAKYRRQLPAQILAEIKINKVVGCFFEFRI